MSSPFPAFRFPASSRMALTNPSPFLQKFKGLPLLPQTHYCVLSTRQQRLSHIKNTRCIVSLAANMAAGQSDGPDKLNLDRSLEVVRKLWDSLPQPVKSFPWTKTFSNFAHIILELVYAVTKYLCLPLLAVSSLSEMSYCAQERKMILIPIPLLAGIAVAGVLKDTAIELSPELKEEEFPWHLLAIAVFFTLLKLPGPYYPYWGRILVPHFANGGLWRTLWFAFLWYRRPRESLRTAFGTSVDESHSKEKKL
ncbi:uncharacterized protein LOC131228953 [Magnolia sinica]|uniref:uncharacterized protein LOC131228953 n=1 Tax=Magnolia sinica TaxID=86752 RepID=UPI002658ECB9|nr:uncharacterized protein LOC131228953 [Magnolia sinica]XP_058080770.1 uncharacterized protein LOC131228953 [Magnolia sinica]XP_058080771.1 uncharacterized protein LOC131228953 [Magnolia sinica]XP_058080772.1 uncharacterized protein LOC131228953 [Magnolia sinica]